MKHVFVINPKAGKIDRVKEISEKLTQFANEIDYEIYETKARGDASHFVKEYLESHDKNETYRFYACGGDGTLHDVANGAYGFDNAEVACYACGSGNDFIKSFGNGPEFKDLASLIKGESKQIDLIKCNDMICINIYSIGFDGEVTFKMHDYKRRPLITGKMAYNLAALNCLLFNMRNKFKVTLDDELMFDDDGLLIAICNGTTYGGGFLVGPEAKVDDGLFDVCLSTTIPRIKCPALMGIFKKGEHLTNKKLSKYIMYKKAKKVTIESPKPIAFQVDGECFRTTRVDAEILPLALRFVIPAKLEEAQ